MARILREVATRLETGQDGGVAWDANGNRVGQWQYMEDEAESEDTD